MAPEITLLDERGQEIGLLQDYDPPRYTRVLNGVGNMEITGPGDGGVYDLPDGARISVRLWRNGQWEEDFGGPVLVRRLYRQGQRIGWTLRAASYEHYMAGRPIRPTGYNPPTTPGTYDRRSGAADAVMKGFVRRAFGIADGAAGPGTGQWAWPSALTVQIDANQGNTVSWDGRFDPLLEALQKIARAGGVDFAIVRTDSGLEFQTYWPVRGLDRRVDNEDGNTPVILSTELGTLGDWEWSRDISAVENFLIVAGQGELDTRAVTEVQSPESIVRSGFWPAFVDASAVSDPTSLANEGRGRLIESGEAAEAHSMKASEGSPYEYGVDWDLGDVLTARTEVADIRVDAQVVQVDVTVSPGGVVTATPTLGAPPLLDRLKRRQRRYGDVAKRD